MLTRLAGTAKIISVAEREMTTNVPATSCEHGWVGQVNLTSSYLGRLFVQVSFPV